MMNQHDMARIAVESGVSVYTIGKWAKDPRRIKNRVVRMALERACEKLQLQLPTVPSSATDG